MERDQDVGLWASGRWIDGGSEVMFRIDLDVMVRVLLSYTDSTADCFVSSGLWAISLGLGDQCGVFSTLCVQPTIL